MVTTYRETGAMWMHGVPLKSAVAVLDGQRVWQPYAGRGAGTARLDSGGDAPATCRGAGLCRQIPPRR